MAKITKEEAIKRLSERKVRVTPDESEQVQKKLFGLGFRWDDGYRRDSSMKVRYKDKPYIFIRKDVAIWYGNYEKFFSRMPYEEITVDEIMAMDIMEEVKIRLGKKWRM